jgi:multiple sugar transport system ATP-binding protein
MSTIRLQDVRVVYERDTPLERSVSGVVGGIFGRGRATSAVTERPGAQQEPPRSVALDGVNLEIRNGETMGVIGPSGCGKSTLLRAIAGLIPLTDGIITYDDQDMREVPPGERGIGIVFQSYALYPNMTGGENIGFFFRVRKREQEIPERIREVSRVMGIGFDKLINRQPAWLSGGERQRVAVARCIARDPRLFLFDEPFSNLDAKLRVQTRGELKRLIYKYKVTGVYVTHDQTEALALCDRIAIMNDGKIEQVGTAHFLHEHPISTLVATFYGHPPMNMFEGTVVEGYWHGDDFTVPLPEAGEGRAVTLGIRAEHIHYDPAGPLRGEIVLIEPVPVQRANLVYVELARSKLVAQIPQVIPVHVGGTISFSIDPDHCHRFDTRTGRRL